MLGYRFSFPVNNTRILPLDHPEIRLASLLVLATKLCFPFKVNEPSNEGLGTAYMPQVEWEAWKRALIQHPDDKDLSDKAAVFEAMTPNQVVHMTDEELDAYFAHVSGLVDNKSKFFSAILVTIAKMIKDENPITQFFPTEDTPAPAPSAPEASEDEIHERASLVMKQALGPPNSPRAETGERSSGGSNGATYEAFRNVEDLSETAAAFYKATGTVHSVCATSLFGVRTLIRLLPQAMRLVFPWTWLFGRFIPWSNALYHGKKDNELWTRKKWRILYDTYLRSFDSSHKVPKKI